MKVWRLEVEVEDDFTDVRVRENGNLVGIVVTSATGLTLGSTPQLRLLSSEVVEEQGTA